MDNPYFIQITFLLSWIYLPIPVLGSTIPKTTHPNHPAIINPDLLLTTHNNLIQIGDREPYEAQLTLAEFLKPVCISEIRIDTLWPLTGAEDIEIAYSKCRNGDILNKGGHLSNFGLIHYTNNKNVFALKYPILAHKIVFLIESATLNKMPNKMVIQQVFVKTCNGTSGEPGQTGEHDCRLHANDENAVTRQRITTHGAKATSAANGGNSTTLGGKQQQPHRLRHRGSKSDVLQYTRVKRQSEKNPIDTAPSDCPSGYRGLNCSQPDCSSLRQCHDAGVCISPDVCRCHANYFGSDCSRCSGWFCNQCDFYCVHGYCDVSTKTCMCRRGWSGAACDVCSYADICTIDTNITLLLPQSGPLSASQSIAHVFVHGIDFPKTPNQEYQCYYDEIATSGQWISSDLVRCALPGNVTVPKKYTVTLSPNSSRENQIAIKNLVPLHFSFYQPCSTTSCRGHCFGPYCVCANNQTGLDCNGNASQPEETSTDSSERQIWTEQRATELETYTFALPKSFLLTGISSSIMDGIEIDFLKNKIIWPRPLGSTQPYTVTIEFIENSIPKSGMINVRVDQLYIPAAIRITTIPTSNVLLLSGMIVPHTPGIPVITATSNVPVTVDIVSLENNQSTTIESYLKIVPSPLPNFELPLYPYASNLCRSGYFVKLRHPTDNDPQTNCIRLPACRPQSESISARSLPVVDYAGGNDTDVETLVLTYAISEEFLGNCPEFDIFVTAYRDTSMGSNTLWEANSEAENFNVSWQQLIKQADTVQVNVLLPRCKKQQDALIAFYCGPTTVVFKSMDIPETECETEETEMDEVNFSGKTTTFTLEPLGITTELRSKSKIDYPLEVTLVNTNREILIKKILYLNDVFTFTDVKPDRYQLTIRSVFFSTYNNLITITTNSSLTVFLQRKLQYLPTIINGQDLEVSQTLIGQDPSIQPGAEVVIEPSVFKLADLVAANNSQPIFVSVIYRQGPKRSFFIPDNSADENAENPTFLHFEENSGQSLCVTCGIRVTARVVLPSNLLNLKCNILSGVLTGNVYILTLDKMKIQKTNATYFLDLRKDKTEKVTFCLEPKKIAHKTHLLDDCASTKLMACKRLYQPIHLCGKEWSNIDTETLSIFTYAGFVRLYLDCKLKGVSLNQMKDMIECYTSIEKDCPLYSASSAAASNPPTTNNVRQNFFLQYEAIRPLTKQLETVYFPTLNLVQDVEGNYPLVMSDFLDAYLVALPPDELEAINEWSWLDAFYTVVGDSTPHGAIITEDELALCQGCRGFEAFYDNWNETATQLSGAAAKGGRIDAFRRLIIAADRLKNFMLQVNSTSRPSDPFASFHGILTRVLESKYHPDKVLAEAVAIVSDYKITESEEFEISLVLNNLMASSITKIRLKLEIIDADTNQKNMFYRMGPLYFIGGVPDNLLPWSSMTATWKVHPAFTRRLTHTITQIPSIIATFEANGKRKTQRISAATIQIVPERQIRLLALARQLKSGEKPQFLIAIMNTGYAALTDLVATFTPNLTIFNETQLISVTGSQVKNITLCWPDDSTTQLGDGAGDIVISRLESAEKIVLTGFVDSEEAEKKISNISAQVITKENKLLDKLDTQFYYITNEINSTRFILTKNQNLVTLDDELYFFDLESGKLGSVYQTQIIEQKLTNATNSEFLEYNIVATFERLLTSDDASTELTIVKLLEKNSTIYGRILYPSELPPLQLNTELPVQEPVLKLNRIMDLGPAGMRRRTIDISNVWITNQANETLLNFIDTNALPPTLTSTLTYEFTLGTNDNINKPYFRTTFDIIQVPGSIILRNNTVVDKVTAESPVGSRIEYSMTSDLENSPFSIHKKSGEIILQDSYTYEMLRDLQSNGICYTVTATDVQNRSTSVNVRLTLNDNTPTTISECSATTTFTHVYDEISRSGLWPMELQPQTVETTTTERSRVSTVPEATTDHSVFTSDGYTTDPKQPALTSTTETTQNSTEEYSTTTKIETEITTQTRSVISKETTASWQPQTTTTPARKPFNEAEMEARARINDATCNANRNKPIWGLVCDIAKTVNIQQ